MFSFFVSNLYKDRHYLGSELARAISNQCENLEKMDRATFAQKVLKEALLAGVVIT